MEGNGGLLATSGYVAPFPLPSQKRGQVDPDLDGLVVIVLPLLLAGILQMRLRSGRSPEDHCVVTWNDLGLSATKILFMHIPKKLEMPEVWGQIT